ncbi:hypothetical protein T440DRAFT_436681 [Plenodomus tracheiphilus IPT5]|uniref:EGF-like domain-containing protein n=1 Tax=Plenodomus tracheiphilus IPT5 TaxID=1408161 RepID=A0A6A7AM96_9PLEO|nr:hypothetical protein T440DRAFT_436681 [Plenodomus tracheiphilus IPT5]
MVHFNIALASLLILASSAYACDGLFQCKFQGGGHCCLLPGTGYGPKNCPDACNGGTAWPPECVSGARSGSRRNCKCGAFNQKCVR